MTYFAFELTRVLNQINKQAFNDLKMRIGNFTLCTLILCVVQLACVHGHICLSQGSICSEGREEREVLPSFSIVIPEFSSSITEERIVLCSLLCNGGYVCSLIPRLSPKHGIDA